METISAADYAKRYGSQGVQAHSTVLGDIKNAFTDGINQVKEGISQAKTATNPLQKTEAGLQEGAGLVGAAFAPLAPATKYIGKAIDYAGSKLSDVPLVKGAAGNMVANQDGTISYVPNQSSSRVIQDISNTATLLGVAAGAEGAPGMKISPPKGVSATVSKAGSGLDSTISSGTKYLSGATRDIVPTSQGIINHQVTKALDLAPSDLNKITRSTGHDVGTWLADNNLIGENKVTTQKNITDFTNLNYKTVRKVIGDVNQTYQATDIPRYTDALNAIKKQIDDVPGLEQSSSEVNLLLRNEHPTLMDVQRVKELLDEHFNLYKMTGDVKEGAQKEGLSNIRSDIQTFIEGQAKEHTGYDVGPLNKNVATGKTLNDAIETRAPKGLTQANIKLGDLGIFGVGMSFGGPLGGAALVFAKKLLETPTVRLRVAKYIDGLSDARKAAVQEDLVEGKIPLELKQFIKERSSVPVARGKEQTK